MKTSYRDLTCGDARPEHAGREVTLSGWVNRRRDMGQLIFIDLRDRYGVTQVVIDAKTAAEAHATATGVRNEFVLPVEGKLDKRLAGTENAKLPTGEMELRATSVRDPVDRRSRRRSRSTTRTRHRRDAAAEVPLPRPAPRAAQPPAGHALEAAAGDLARCTTRTASSRSRRRS